VPEESMPVDDLRRQMKDNGGIRKETCFKME